LLVWRGSDGQGSGRRGMERGIALFCVAWAARISIGCASDATRILFDPPSSRCRARRPTPRRGTNYPGLPLRPIMERKNSCFIFVEPSELSENLHEVSRCASPFDG